MVETALASGSSGPIYIVNPKYQEIEKTQCYPSLSSWREAPDLVAAGESKRCWTRPWRAFPFFAAPWPPVMREMDVNPVIATPEGCFAVDALVLGGR